MSFASARPTLIYARQSLDSKDSISIETQIAKCESALEQGEEYKVYVDRGFSGKNTKRPQLQEMLQEIDSGNAGRIIVYRLDRFSRSILDFAGMWDILEKHHVEFVSVNEHFDTSTPIGKAMVFIIVLFAQMERETIAERITDNYYDRVKSGRWPGGPAPWGCRISRIQACGKLVPTLEYEPEIEIVEELYHRYCQDSTLSLGQLAKELTGRRIPGPRDKPWSNVALARLLRNPVWVKADADIYAYFDRMGVSITNRLEEFQGTYGCVLVGKRENHTRTRRELKEAQLSIANWPGRISSGIWLEVQSRLARNRQIGNTGKGKYTWLSGLLKCGHCGKALVVGGERKDILYCSGYQQNTALCSHGGGYPPVRELEAQVQEELNRILKQCENGPSEEDAGMDNEDKLQLIRLDRKIGRLIDMLTEEEAAPLTLRYVNKELERLHEQRSEIADHILPEKKKAEKYSQIQFEELDLEEKKLVARSYIDKIFVFADSAELLWLI